MNLNLLAILVLAVAVLVVLITGMRITYNYKGSVYDIIALVSSAVGFIFVTAITMAAQRKQLCRFGYC